MQGHRAPVDIWRKDTGLFTVVFAYEFASGGKGGLGEGGAGEK
jgi:hypothetical protein